MEDPFGALVRSLEPVFHLEAMRNGKYTFSPIQRLKDATQAYKQKKVKATYSELLMALRESLPFLEKWQVDFNSIITNMDNLALRHNMQLSNWNKILKHPKVSLKFQFSALNHSTEIELIPWITSKTGKLMSQINHFELTEILIDLRNEQGFSQKLSAHLNKEPDFLVKLILSSERNFNKILHTRISLFLNDAQIANAIIEHLPKLVNADAPLFTQVDQIVNKINSILSNGRSISTMLRNSEAKVILERSELFRLYQSPEYINHKEEIHHVFKG